VLTPAKTVWQRDVKMEFRTKGPVSIERTKIRTSNSFSTRSISIAQRKQFIYPIPQSERNANENEITVTYFEIKIICVGLLGYVTLLLLLFSLSVLFDSIEKKDRAENNHNSLFVFCLLSLCLSRKQTSDYWTVYS
jgi:hypothetical protein